MNTNPNNPNDDGGTPPLPPHDELDLLLRQWHAANADKAAAGRDRIMAALSHEDRLRDGEVLGRIEPEPETSDARRPFTVIRRIIVNRYSPLAAAAILLAVALPFILSGKHGLVSSSLAKESTNIVMAPEGGRLDAFDAHGNALGPCTLRHTDVKAEISGRFSRVTVKQQYHNANPDKVEAVYTFPLSDRSGVDRMTMTIGDRVIVGEVKERFQARRVYEQAKHDGRVASILEQERPNIFTQSIANLEPGATIDIEISYVEMVAEHDGEFSFAFPTVVSPRYIPGSSEYHRERIVPLQALPLGFHSRRGLILTAPGTVSSATLRDAAAGERSPDDLGRMFASATPIEPPAPADISTLPAVWYETSISYPDGSAEPAIILTDRRGAIGGRWFYCPPAPAATTPPGDGFSQPTTQVPDADRITPMPTRPDTRAGHDISISVTMDTGGPGITSLESPQHKIVREDLAKTDRNQPRRVSLALANLAEIPNRDFVLKWKQTSDNISSRVFTHTGDTGNFFCVQLDPPAVVKDIRAVPRELVFVVDTSGSMDGRPISLCQEVMRKAIDQMRPQDTFNIITFAGATRIMWDRPRPNTTVNRDEAQKFIDTWHGEGGTEMMTAIEAALRQGPVAGSASALTAAQLADLPADGRQVIVEADDGQFRSEGLTPSATTDRATLFIRDDLSIKCAPFQLPEAYLKRANQTVADDSITLKLLLRGVWTTVNGERIFQVSSAEMSHDSSVRPLRLVMFLTDAEVGNDMAIIDAVKRNRATTRVFPFGIGTSVNRFLIEQMALAGGGEPEFIYANSASEQQAADAIERFNRRTKTPLLTDISIAFNGVQPLDVLPDLTTIPDLYDNRPLTLMGRYQGAATGTLTIKGQSAQGRWESTIPLVFPAKQAENSSLPTIWARAKIDSIMAQDLIGIQRGQPNPDVRARIITLGETFNVMSQFTSFVAVDKLRVTLDGLPRLVHIPIELPDQTNWAGFFGELPPLNDDGQQQRLKDKGAEDNQHGRRLMLKTEVLDRLVASNEALLKQQEESKMVEGLDKLDATNKRSDLAGAGRAGGGAPVATLPASQAAAAPAPPADRSVSPPAAPNDVASTPAPTKLGSGAAPARTPIPAGSASRSAASKAPQTPQPAVQFRIVERAGQTTVPPAGATPAPESVLNFALAPRGSQESERDPLNEAVAQRARGGGGGQSPFLGNFGLDIAADSAPASDPQSDGESEKNTPWMSWWARSEPSSLADFNRDGAVAPEDLRAYFKTLRDDGIVNINSSNLSTLVALGRNESSIDPVQFLALAAAQLAESGQIDKAQRLVCSTFNVQASAGAIEQNGLQLPTDRLCGALNSKAPEAERAAAIREVADQASARILGRIRAETLARKLAPDVIALTPTAERSRTLAAQADEKSEVFRKAGDAAKKTEEYKRELQPAGGSLMLTLLLADTSTKTIDALKALGLKIEAVRPEASVVIARVPLDKLEALALMDAVKRIELVPMDGTTVK